MCSAPARKPWTNRKFLHCVKVLRTPWEEFYFTKKLRKLRALKRVLGNGADILNLCWLAKGDSFPIATLATPACNCKSQDEAHKRTIANKWKVHLTCSPVWDNNPEIAWGRVYSNAFPSSSSSFWLWMQSPEPESLNICMFSSVHESASCRPNLQSPGSSLVQVPSSGASSPFFFSKVSPISDESKPFLASLHLAPRLCMFLILPWHKE